MLDAKYATTRNDIFLNAVNGGLAVLHYIFVCFVLYKFIKYASLHSVYNIFLAILGPILNEPVRGFTVDCTTAGPSLMKPS